MPATEELRVYIRTVADTSGVKETQRAVQETRRSLSAAGAAAIGGVAGFAADKATDAVQALGQAFSSSVDAARQHERVIRASSMAYGEAASQYQKFASQLEATTGFTSDAILEAALSARTLSQNYGLTIDQTQKLIRVSADLARVRGIGIAESFERVQSAIRGEAEASEYLGLTLNDTFLTNQAMNGSLKTTFGTMTDVQKAQVRYSELLKQAGQFTDLATSKTDSLDASFGRAETSAHRLQVAFGEFTKGPTIAGLNVLERAARAFAEGFEGKDTGAVRFRKFLEELGKGQSLAGAATAAQSFAFPGVTVISPELAKIKDAAPGATKALYDTAAAAKRLKDDAEAAVRPGVTVISSALQDLKETSDQAGKLASIAFKDQLQAAFRDVKQSQVELVDLQRQSVDLAAEEARVRQSLLPAQQQMAALQRDIAEQQLRARMAALPATEALEDLQRAQQVSHLIQATNTSLQEQQIRARMAALPAAEALEDLQRAQEMARLVQQADTTLQQNMLQARLAAMPASNALEDLNYEQQRARLIASNRNASASERSAARRELRELNRQEPGVALSALEAGRGVTSASRASERADIQQQMVNLADQAALATAQLAANQAQQGELEAKRAADRASLEQQLKDLAEQATLAVAQIAATQAQQAELEAGRAAARVDIVAQLQAIADARALQPVLDATQANQLQQTITTAVLAAQQELLQKIAEPQKTPIMLSVNITHADGRVDTYSELIEANQQAVIPPAIELSGLRRR